MTELRLQTFKLPTGRTVTGMVKWWYENGPFHLRGQLFCIHNRSLLEGCNECNDE